MAHRAKSTIRNQNPKLRVAGLFLRRKPGQEFHSYVSILNYDPNHYEVLLRKWPTDPLKNYLGAFSGPAIAGEDPQITVLRESQYWSINLAGEAGLDCSKGLEGRRAVFLSVQGGGRSQEGAGKSRGSLEGIVLSYVVPVKHTDSSIVSDFPSTPEYPRFYSLGEVLKKMIEGGLKIHPNTRPMLSALDHWLREQHSLPGAVNALFAPSLESRIKMSIVNPMVSTEGAAINETPNQSFTSNPVLSSTPFPGAHDESSVQETSTLAKLRNPPSNAVNFIAKNPLFGSGLVLDKANRTVLNKYFGRGEPDYEAVNRRRGKWVIQVQGDGLPDWTELYPMHKFACAGDDEGVRRCIRLGMSVDERDSDSWSPLHYACWYGELDVVTVLVGEGSASIGIQNNAGSTPLHLAAATGHKDAVSFLLQQKGVGMFKAALDNDGKSPLAVCLECKSNDWQETSRILRESYKTNTAADGLPLSPTLLSFSAQPTPSVENLLLNRTEAAVDTQEELDIRGSLRNIDSVDNNESPRKGKAQTVRRHRVNFANGQHRVAHFFNGRDTSAGDVIQDIYRLIKLKNEYHSVFSLWVVSKDLDIQLGDTDKPLKLMASWKRFVTQYKVSTPRKNHFDGEAPTLYIRRNVFYPVEREKTISDVIALEFLYSDAQRHVLSGYYPCSEDDALYLAGITMQVLYGDYSPSEHRAGFLKDRLHQVLPSHMMSSKRKVEYERRVLAKYAEMTNLNIGETKLLFVAYLKHCRQWKYYAAVFFDGSLQTKGARLMYHGKLGRKSELAFSVGVNTAGFHFVNRETNEYLDSLPLDGVEWDVSKNQVLLYKKDRSVNLLINTKRAGLIHSMVTRLVEQYTGVGAEASRISITAS